MLGELTINGQPRKVVMFANRNGFFYTHRSRHRQSDRRQAVRRDDVGQGDRLRAAGPMLLPGHTPDEDGNKTCPDLGGGTNFMSPSFDPTTRLFFVTARETCATYFAFDQKFKPGEQYTGGGQSRPRDQKNFGALRAIDPVTAQMKWEFRYTSVSASGVLTHRVGARVRGRRRRQHHGVRLAHREEPVALPARVLDALDGGDDLHARWPAVSAGAVGEHADGVRAAGSSAEIDDEAPRCALALLLLGNTGWTAQPLPHFTRDVNRSCSGAVRPATGPAISPRCP